RSTNGGMTWGNNVRLTNNPGNSGKVSISASGSFVNIVWNDTRDGNAEIYYKKSTDNGATWSADMRLTNAPNVSQMPSVSQSGLNVHVVWEDYRNSNAGEIFNKNSTDGGQTWSSDLLIANDLLSSWLPSMSVSGTSIHIAYIVQVTPSHFEIFYKKSSDNGLTWGSGVRLTNTSVNSGLPSIFSYGSAIHLVYTSGYLPDIYYIRSTNNGNTWETETRLTNDPAESDNPSVSVSNSAVHVVWNDSRDGNREIYYKKNPTGNVIYSISGTITYSDNSQPVSEGFVKALTYDPETSEIITVDSAVINSNGTYTLGHIPNDSVDIMFYQNDDLLDFVPTYYVSTIDWREATTIYVTQNLTNINGQVYRINNQTNPYNISGQTFQNTPGDNTIPISDAIIYAKIGSEFKNYGISLSNGSYIATKLPPGSYTLIAHRMGFNPVTQNVTITSSSLQNINFNFGSPIGIQPISNQIPSKFRLHQNYPNPFN